MVKKLILLFLIGVFVLLLRAEYRGFEHKRVHEEGMNIAMSEVGLQDAWKVCGDRYYQGCRHGLVMNLPFTTSSEFIKACSGRIKFTTNEEEQNCWHGIGHGLLKHMNLSDALDMCDAQRQFVYECVSGVYMEQLQQNNTVSCDQRHHDICEVYKGRRLVEYKPLNILWAYRSCLNLSLTDQNLCMLGVNDLVNLYYW